MIYLDTSYLVRLYYKDPGYEAVRELASGATVACSLHGRAEVVAALHRKLREGLLPAAYYPTTLQEFQEECRTGAFHWLPVTAAVVDRLETVYASIPVGLFLRAADALHLACAAENRFREVYSHDQHLLAAAREFGLKGVNVI